MVKFHSSVLQDETGSHFVGREQGNEDLFLPIMLRQIIFLLLTTIQDPTLQRSRDINCAKCGFNEAVFFQVSVEVLSHSCNTCLLTTYVFC